MQHRRILATAAALATVVGGAMTALAPAGATGPSGLALGTARPGSELVRGSDGSAHALIPARPLVRPVGLARTAAPATIAKAFLADRAKAFGTSASQLRATQTVGFGASGSTVRFQQSLGGLPVLGGELVVSLDGSGSLQSITGEAASGAVAADSRTGLSAATQASRARAFVTKRTGAKSLHAIRIDTVVFNPQLLGLPNGVDLNLRVERFLVTGPGVSYFVFVHKGLGVVGGFSNGEEADNRLICAANNQVFYDPNDAYCEGTNARVRVTRAEGQAPSFDKDTNSVYDNLGYTQRAYTAYAGFDLATNVGLTAAEAGGTAKTKRLRATVHYCDPDQPCPMPNAFWNDTYDPDTGDIVGGQMYYGAGVTQDDITGHEVSHGVTAATSNLYYWFQSGSINESMSDVFGELVDLLDTGYGAPAEDSKYAWQIGEGSSLGVIRSMKSPTSVPQWDGTKGQPDRMTSTSWWDVGADDDAGGVHLNSGVGNKAAYLIAAGGTFNGQTIRKLGYAKTFTIYWATENLLTSGANYQDLYSVLPAACTKSIGVRAITADDCAQVKKAVIATEMNKSPRSTVTNKPVITTLCPAGTTYKTVLSEGFDATPAGWSGVTLIKRDLGVDYVKTGADSAYVAGGTAHPLKHTTGVVVPAGGRLRVTYAVFDSVGQHGTVQYRTTATGTLQSLPSTNSVNRGPWGASPGWSSARWDLSSLAGKRIYLQFATDEPDGYTEMLVDNVKVYTCV